ncbi:MAG: hypothetical protein LC793_16265 [Thermomicrobia bacterium]|nr:hypothetical protein [Thermomicrobia bacterium]MCA1723029.1 hypothetical protein [Thermomicrobia bacterium]
MMCYPDSYDIGPPLTEEEQAALDDEMRRLDAESANEAMREREEWEFWCSEEGQERLRRMDAAIEWGGF